MQTETKQCQNCKTDFIIEPEDFNFYEKIKVPPPTWCPKCRLKRRLSFRNERTLYKRSCDKCKESIISNYSPRSTYTVYCMKCWYGDSWDPYSYGRDYDFSKPFFEQFMELDKRVPHPSLFQENNVNSPWVNYEMDDKNCYLNFGGHFNQDCAYNQYALKSRDCFDNFWMMHGEFSQENILCENVYKTFGSIFCFECQETWFSFDCRNCSNIIGCSGLRHKNYHIFNKQVTKKEYEEFVAKNISGLKKSNNELKEKSQAFWKSVPQRASFIERSVNCIGNLIKDSHNCRDVYNVEKSENIAYAMFTLGLKDSVDVTSVWEGELMYEVMAGIFSSDILCSSQILDQSSSIAYCNSMRGSSNCFGSSHIKQGEFVILNKRYSKEEYESLKEKIRNHMDKMPYVDRKERVYNYGEFFPYEASPFSYKESVANEYFPLSEEDILKEGANSLDHSVETNYDVEIIDPPNSISDVDESILGKAIKCRKTGKLFRLIKMELDFYKRFNLPVPTESPFSRHHDRLRFVSDHLGLLKRNCGKCGIEVNSVYKPEDFPIVYCETCYQKEVY